ncbi:MAG: hypothetical protein HN521_17635, partial [Candidatus Latescibacteria bacterium]|nr:hypothetical protein [Candidatus Latescibacterota bacterium]
MPENIKNTIVRLTFHISSDQKDEFESVYQERLLPILQQCGLETTDRALRKMPPRNFAHLFAIKSPTDLPQIRQTLRSNPEWRNILFELASTFGNPMPDGLLFYVLELYQTTSTNNDIASSTTGQGAWRAYDATNGLASGFVFSMIEDRDGKLWFSAFGGGISCFDGQTFRTYTRDDGLAHNEVFSVFQDSTGIFWFATELGA